MELFNNRFTIDSLIQSNEDRLCIRNLIICVPVPQFLDYPFANIEVFPRIETQMQRGTPVNTDHLCEFRFQCPV